MSGQIEFSVEGDQRKSHFPILFINFKSHVKTFCACLSFQEQKMHLLSSCEAAFLIKSSRVISSHLKAWLSSSKTSTASAQNLISFSLPSLLSNEELIPSFVSGRESKKSFFTNYHKGPLLQPLCAISSTSKGKAQWLADAWHHHFTGSEKAKI